MKKKIIVFLLLISLATTIFADSSTSPPKSRLSSITAGFVKGGKWLAGLFGLDEDDILGSLGEMAGDALKEKVKTMALEFLGGLISEAIPIGPAFAALFGGEDGEDSQMQRNFDAVIGILKENQELIIQSREDILNAVYKSYLTAEVWNRVDTITDSLHSSTYDSNKYNWKTLNIWDENRRKLSGFAEDITNAVNAWENAAAIHDEARMAQYKTFPAYIDAVSMEIHTHIDYKNVLKAESYVLSAPENDVTAGLSAFEAEYKDFYNNTIRPAVRYIMENAFIYISSLDDGWKQASDSRFSAPATRASTISYKSYRLVENQFLHDELAGYDDTYRTVTYTNGAGGVPKPHFTTHDKYWFYSDYMTYTVNGLDMNITMTRVKDHQDSRFVKTFIVTPYSLRSIGPFVKSGHDWSGYSYIRSVDGYYVYEKSSTNLTLNDLLAIHKDIEYYNFLQKTLEPALYTMDGWFRMVNGNSGSRAASWPLQAERDLNTFYDYYTTDITSHRTIWGNQEFVSDVVIHNGGILSILNGGAINYGEYKTMYEEMEVPEDNMITSLLGSTIMLSVNRNGKVVIPPFRTLRVKAGGTLVIPGSLYSALVNGKVNQLVVEPGAKVVLLDGQGNPPKKADIEVIMTIINTILLD